MLLMSGRIESLSIGESFSVSLLGFAIVFFVLVVLMAVISLLRLAVNKAEGPAAAPAVSVVSPAAVADLPVAASAAPPREVMLNGIEHRTAVMIMAIVADRMNTPLNELRFVSIKEKGDQKGMDKL